MQPLVAATVGPVSAVTQPLEALRALEAAYGIPASPTALLISSINVMGVERDPQNAEDAAYLVKYLLNGSTGTPMKDMLRTVTRTFRSRPVDRKTVSVSASFLALN